jgi:formylglycine-generating enzyme required for sulfatase activity/subtilisin-like proprotein convertase family protein
MPFIRRAINGVVAAPGTAAAALGGTTITTLATAAVLAAAPPQPRAGDPLADLTWGQSQRFIDGRQAYITPLTLAQGLGPAFNRHSCVDCHETPIGGWSSIKVTHFGLESPGGFDFLEHLGGPVLQADAIGDDCRELVPAVANHIRERVTPSVLAFGLVEAIPDAALLALADPNDANGDGISGRAHMVQPLESPTGPQRVGRFGWKAQIATVRSFSGDAARTEMGLTNAVVTEETAPNGDQSQLDACDTIPELEDRSIGGAATFVDRVTDFQRFLAPPPQSPRGGMTGETIFTQIGCAACHTPSFTTGTDPAIEPALRGRTIRPYSDFLLHDMGALADGIPDGQALPREMKTPPLWNLHTRPVLLHDGSVFQGDFATKVTAAVLAHAGEATTSRNAFQALPPASKAQVLAFLDSLGRNDFDADGDDLLSGSDLASAIGNSNDLDVSPDEPWAVADLDQDRRIEADEIAQLQQLLGVPADCNQDGVADWSQIASGTVTDANQNGEPDECDQSSCIGRAVRRQGTGGTIPDNNPSNPLIRTVTFPTLAGNPTVRELRVVLDITHTWLSDLTITLQRGTDTPITLHSGCGGTNDVIGVYRFVDTAWEGAPGSLVRVCDGQLIDQGGSNPDTRFRYATGTYRPAQGAASTGFQAVRGLPLAGTWTLRITDSRLQDVGTLNAWAIEVRYTDPAPTDCDGALGPDCEQIAQNPSRDCDQDGVLDACQPMAEDCDGDGRRDRCQVHDGTAQDCDGNGVLDQCDLAAGTVQDCNNNGTPDACDRADGEPDQDNDGLLDACERAWGDLNLDGLVDGADLGALLSVWGNGGLGDLDGDGTAGGSDLGIILAHWGEAPLPPPTLASVAPPSGPAAGGTEITLTGTNLLGAISVTVGGIAASGVQVVNSTTVTAFTPAGTPGLKSVGVTTASGMATLAGGFNHLPAPPTLASVEPSAGPVTGGTQITLTGTNLFGPIIVTVGGVAASGVQVVNSTTATALTPAGTVGPKVVGLTTAGGTATLASGFNYLPAPPTLVSVQPSFGPTAGGTQITLTGTNFLTASSVTVGGLAASNVQVVNSSTVTAITPAGTAGLKSVSVTSAGGTAALSNAFNYVTVVVPPWATLLEALPDPAVVTNSTLRAAINSTGLAWRVRDTATQIEMLLIPPGTFQMGCSPSQSYICEDCESPVHTVNLTNAYYIGRYEVTQAQWQARMGSNPSFFKNPSVQVPAAQVPSRPVEYVSWNDVQGFLTQTGMRLPTEAEWEFAYRAGTTTAFSGFASQPNGTNSDSLLGNIAWYSANSNNQTRPVGGKLPNGFGLHDMAGNVFEWVSDWFGYFYYSNSPTTNPLGPITGDDEKRVLRGGDCVCDSFFCRASGRSRLAPVYYSYLIGFRVVRNP